MFCLNDSFKTNLNNFTKFKVGIIYDIVRNALVLKNPFKLQKKLSQVIAKSLFSLRVKQKKLKLNFNWYNIHYPNAFKLFDKNWYDTNFYLFVLQQMLLKWLLGKFTQLSGKLKTTENTPVHMLKKSKF